jgi:hypothetical protein
MFYDLFKMNKLQGSEDACPVWIRKEEGVSINSHELKSTPSCQIFRMRLYGQPLINFVRKVKSRVCTKS